MLYFDREKINPAMAEDVSRLIQLVESEQKVSVLFGAAYSSIAYGFGSAESDLDIYLFFRAGSIDAKIMKKVYADLYMNATLIDYDYCLSNSGNLISLYSQYPTVLHRELASPNLWAFSYDDYLTTTKFFEALISPIVYDSGYLKGNFEDVLNSINVLLLLDYLYSRAYGNLTQHLSKPENEAKRVLRAFWSTAIMKAVIETKGIPSSNVGDLINQFAPVEHVPFLVDTLNSVRQQRCAKDIDFHQPNLPYNELIAMGQKEVLKVEKKKDKAPLFIPRNDAFNHYLFDELKIIGVRMERLAAELSKMRLEKGQYRFF